MDTKTLDALQSSKLHWCNIRDGLEEEHGIRNCPLCKLFYGKCCVGCPVFEKTGEVGCKNTPYIAWTHHHKLKHGLTKIVRADCPECKKLAQAELDFLESLLPNMEKAVRNLQKQYNNLAKDKPAPEPGEFVVKEVWKAQSTEDITIFTRIDKTGRYLCFTDNQVEIRLNANEARKEAIDEYLNLDKIGSHPQYSWSDLKRDIQAIDDYEGGR